MTCGSVVKLQHIESGAYLHSEEKNLGGGSGQQIVTWIPEIGGADNLWWFREGNDDAYCVAGHPIVCGSKIRLTHLDTMRNLHTHNVQSPLSRQQEVSCFGQGDGNGDTGDDWIVECSTGNWKRGESVRLKHVDTGKYLGGSSTVKFTQQNCGHGTYLYCRRVLIVIFLLYFFLPIHLFHSFFRLSHYESFGVVCKRTKG